MAPHDVVAGPADLIDNGEADRAEQKDQDDAALLVSPVLWAVYLVERWANVVHDIAYYGL